MKYQVRKYIIPNHESKQFDETAKSNEVRVFSTNTGDEKTVFVTNLKVGEYYGEIGVIDNDDGLEKITIIKEPFFKQPITLKELLDIEPDLLGDMRKFGKLDKMQQALFTSRYKEFDELFEKEKANLKAYKKDLITALLPAVRDNQDIEQFQQTQATLQGLIEGNKETLATIEKALASIETEYQEALVYMKTDEERQKLTEQTEKSKVYYEQWRSDILGVEVNLIGKETISNGIVNKIRAVAEDYPKEYKLLSDLSETRQLLSYIRKEPYTAEEMTIVEMLGVFQSPKEDIEEGEKTEENSKNRTDEGGYEDGEAVSPLATTDEALPTETAEKEELDKKDDEDYPRYDDFEKEDSEEDDVEPETVESSSPKGETVRGSKAIANLLKAVNADYTPDQEEQEDTSYSDEDDEERSLPKAEIPTKERKDVEEELEEGATTKGSAKKFKFELTMKSSIILSCAVLLLGTGGSWFIYDSVNEQTNVIKEKTIDKAKTLDMLKDVTEIDEETYSDLVKRFTGKYSTTRESATTGLSGYFVYEGTEYMVKRLVKNTGTLETYTVDGKGVDFTFDEVETMIEDGE